MRGLETKGLIKWRLYSVALCTAGLHAQNACRCTDNLHATCTRPFIKGDGTDLDQLERSREAMFSGIGQVECQGRISGWFQLLVSWT
ncbi:hypothetical protein BJ138DRAFT_1161078 [Hygrophoropsis aurantiaca]|uniref:Uncharacterized protein n=1 Tax=Hygrophoropsis aurantiaca TaxID=72124 RepID=A0ACB8A2V3_9AGAM|nr:hypothetical protein BJ138DRAFT_1161078 [Hygrophoropsis aurantiaca]